MTYAIGVVTKTGLGFMTDTRTNSGVDNISQFKKLFTWEKEGDYCFSIALAGNLATTQWVKNEIDELVKDESFTEDYKSIFKIAEFIGRSIKSAIARYRDESNERGATFLMSALFGGQLKGSTQKLFLLYPEGNFIETSEDTPFFSIGETKLGRPVILARYNSDLTRDELKELLYDSMEITASTSLTVGLPIDFHFSELNSYKSSYVERINAFGRPDSIWNQLKRPKVPDVLNPTQAGRGDFFDHLRQLKDVTRKLSDHIRSINDPDIATADVRAARAYMDAFQEFIDLDGSNRPEQIPGEMRASTLSVIRRVDWTKISEQANKWAKFILDVIIKI